MKPKFIWAPPRGAHTDDQSGFDIAACLKLEGGGRLLLSIEVKYTDTFSKDPVAWDRYQTHLVALGLDDASTDTLVAHDCSQVLRQIMITDSVRRVGLVPGAPSSGLVDEAIAAVLTRRADTHAHDVSNRLDKAVDVRVQNWTLDRLFETAKDAGLVGWAEDMVDRYLREDSSTGHGMTTGGVRDRRRKRAPSPRMAVTVRDYLVPVAVDAL